MTPVDEPYLLISPVCYSYMAPDGERYLDELWAKDLALHAEYLSQLTVAAPCIVGQVPDNAVRVGANRLLSRITYVDLPAPSRSLVGALASLPRVATRLWHAVSLAKIVHPGLVGWPVPIGWVGFLISKLRSRFILVTIESAPWRIPPGGRAKINKWLRARIYEAVNRCIVNAADLSFFTQEDYRRTLLAADAVHGHVIHASWINDADILSASEARAQWRGKAGPTDIRRFLFAGRLTREKGVDVLLLAARHLAGRDCEVSIDIAGDGPMKAECESARAALGNGVELNLLGMTRYGPDFFALVRSYHAVLVPNLTDEQPRIVYDAYSQAIPILASDTPGLRSCVRDQVTGCLDPAGDAKQLADRIAWACRNVDQLGTMGLAGLEVARSLTHRFMHERRSAVLHEALTGKPGQR